MALPVRGGPCSPEGWGHLPKEAQQFGGKARPQLANPSPSAGSCSSSLLKEEILDPRLASEMQGGLEALVGWQLLSWSCYTLAIWEE